MDFATCLLVNKEKIAFIGKYVTENIKFMKIVKDVHSHNDGCQFSWDYMSATITRKTNSNWKGIYEKKKHIISGYKSRASVSAIDFLSRVSNN